MVCLNCGFVIFTWYCGFVMVWLIYIRICSIHLRQLCFFVWLQRLRSERGVNLEPHDFNPEISKGFSPCFLFVEIEVWKRCQYGAPRLQVYVQREKDWREKKESGGRKLDMEPHARFDFIFSFFLLEVYNLFFSFLCFSFSFKKIHVTDNKVEEEAETKQGNRLHSLAVRPITPHKKTIFTFIY